MTDRFWETLEGRLHKARVRAESTLHLGLEMEPKTKRSARARDRQNIADHIGGDSRLWFKRSGASGAVWPRPRAALTLDIDVFSSAPNRPRLDNVCKWLLDELGAPDSAPVVYADDRQVRWLFASMRPSIGRPDAESVLASELPPVVQTNRSMIYVRAQTVRNRIARAICVSPV